MANESLVMTAEVRDSFSSTLRKLQNDLKSISTTGATSTKTLRQDWKGVASDIQGASGSIARDLLPAMRLGNLAGLTLGAGIGAAAMALKNFAQNTATVANFSKEIGLASQEVAKLQAMGQLFGIDPATTQGNLRTFQNFLQALEKDGGRTISHLREVFGPAGDELAGLLLKPGNFKDKMEAAFAAIRNVSSESTARKIAQDLFGNEAWATAIRNLTDKQAAALARIATKIDENKAAATNFNLALLELNVTTQNLANEALGPLLKVSTSLIEKWKEPIGEGLKNFANDVKSVADQFERIGSFFSNPTWEGFLRLMDSRRGTSAEVPSPGASGTEGIVKGMNSRFGAQGQAPPGSPQKDIPKTNEELRQTNEKLKTATEKQTSVFDRFIAALGLGGDTAGLGPGLGGVSAGGGGLGGAGALREFMGGSGGGASIRRGAPTGGGGGRPVAGAATSTAMRAAMDQLRQEGVPEGNLRAAAAHLVGQAQMESGLDPTKTHDQGTGYGIYGARLERRSAMFDWLAKNGYDRNSLEGQQRFMAHEAMTNPRFGTTRNILMNANEKTLAADTHAITRNFEAPAVINNRSGAVLGAYRALDPGESPAALKDLRMKPGATGGGNASAGIVDFARYAQSNIEGFNQVTALNDRMHQRFRSKHNRGLAADFTLAGGKESSAAAEEKIRSNLQASGLDAKDFTILNEYLKPSRRSTAPHMHVQFNTPEAAERYRRATLLQQQSKAEKAQESKLEANGTVNIHLNDGLRDKNAKVDTDGMFKDVKVNRGRPMSTAEDAGTNPLARASAGF
jgi:hypothetical protein